VPLEAQELLTLPEHLIQFLDFCLVSGRPLFVPISFFRLVIVLSVLRFMDSDYLYGIFKPFPTSITLFSNYAQFGSILYIPIIYACLFTRRLPNNITGKVVI
jgi:hypothetical protein